LMVGAELHASQLSISMKHHVELVCKRGQTKFQL